MKGGSMKNSARFAVVVLVLVQAVLMAVSCGPAATAVPTPPPMASLSPTATSAAVATPTSVEEEMPSPTPEEVIAEELLLPEIPRITCEELKQLMDEGADLVLVDTRFDFSFKAGHLPGAINIPGSALPPVTEEELEAQREQLPWDKLIVLYCD
jgi:hypothetical protein